MNFYKRLRRILYCKKELWLRLKKEIDLIAFQKDWRKRNPYNGTEAVCKFDMDKVLVGKGTYGNLRVIGFDNPKERLEIGSYCSIAGDVTFLLGGEHPLHKITTFPYMQHILGIQPTGGGNTPSKGKIIVEDDVWICHGVLILSGVHIGKGSVIGAGSIVTKDIPPYAIVAGNKIIGYRFDRNVIEQMKSISLERIRKMALEDQVFVLSEEITEETIEMVVKFFQ